MLFAFISSRALSHSAASSSTSVLLSAALKKPVHCIKEPTWQPWHWFRQVADIPVSAGKGVQAGHEAPSRNSASADPLLPKHSGAVTLHAQPGADGASATAPAAPPPSGRSWQQLQLPAAVLKDLRPPTQPYKLTPILSQRPTSTPAQYTPWTPTRALQRRKHVTKRMGFLMHVLEREQMERVRRARPLPDFRAGDVLEVRMMLPEAERKVTIYRGVCIARYHKAIRSSFKLYNVYPECGGVVQHIPLYMPELLGIKVVGRIPASQERLFYLLDRETSDYTFQTGVSAAN